MKNFIFGMLVLALGQLCVDLGYCEKAMTSAEALRAKAKVEKDWLSQMPAPKNAITLNYLAFFKAGIEEGTDRAVTLSRLSESQPKLTAIPHKTKCYLRKICDEQSSLYDKEWCNSLGFPTAALVLASLEAEYDFETSSRFAKAMANSPRMKPVEKDVLFLLAARGLWLRGFGQGENQEYKDLIAKAIRSTDEFIAKEAIEWNLAVKVPNSYDSMVLAKQILQTSQNKTRNLNRSFFVSYAICSSAPATFEGILTLNKMENGDDDMQQHKAAQVLTIASEAAIHQQRLDIVNWAEASLEKVPNAPQSDAAEVLFWKGAYFETHNRPFLAEKEYLKAFKKDMDSEAGVQAGLHLAKCKELQNDTAGALAVLEEMGSKYKKQPKARAKALDHIADLQSRFPEIDRDRVKRYRNESLK